MMVEEQIRQAIIDELQRQAGNSEALSVDASGDLIVINGPIDLDDLIMVVMGSVAGGP